MTKGTWPVLSIAEAEARLTAPGQRFEMEYLEIRGIRTRVWKNAPPTMRDIFNTGRAFGPTREFLVYEDERASYEDFARAAIAIAYELQALGVKKGDRVAIIMRNLPEFVPAYHGILLLGAIATPLNAWWTGQELEYGLRDSGSKVALVDSERLERILPFLSNCPDLKSVFVTRYGGAMPNAMVRPLESVIGKVGDWKKLPDRPLPAVDIHPDDDASILYTSGTTGRSKGALCTHRNITCNILAGAFATARNFLRRGEQVPVFDPKAPPRVSLISIPMFHATALYARLGPLMMIGGKIVFMFRWDVVKALQIIEREKVNQIGGVPTIPWQLLEHPDFHKYDTSTIDQCSYGGAPAAPELVRRIKEAWPKCEPGFGWGMTETAATVTTHIAEEYTHNPESCGPPIGVCDLKILNDRNEEVPVGELGEIWCTGPNMARCYWNKPDATAATFVKNWVRTGDIGRVDEEGYLYIMDRAKDMVLRGGENIYSIEVENALYEHPAVMDCAIIPIPHKVLGEEPGAVVHLKDGAQATEEELRGFVRERLAAFKVPVKIVFWPETLPRNPNGKILKTELKKIFAPAKV